MKMPPTVWWPVGLTLACIVGLLVAEHRRSQPLKWLCKPLAALGFIWAAYAAGAWASSYGQVVLSGLVLCAIGDICLIPTRVERWFLVGLISFLLGHVAYAIAFTMRGLSTPWLIGATVPLAVIGFGVYRWLSPDIQVGMKRPVQAYIAVISTMVALAIATSAADGAWLITIGATMFWLSDISVASARFKGAGMVNRAWGIPMYFLAQLVLAITVFYTDGGRSS
ncbi:MAG: lysoplasmalogenase [Myxococcota bacterium]|nr:lysoplasmalogenase [Myxococcota bacterium]